MFYVFDSVLAYSPDDISVAKSATFTAYDITDTGNVTPLETTDLAGLPVVVTSNSDGMLTVFRVEDHPQVKVVSGDHAQVLTSMTGALQAIDAGAAATATSAELATTAASSAAESLVAAQQRGLPPGGLVEQVPVKTGVNDYEAAWGDVVLRAGMAPVRVWGPVSTLPAADSGQRAGDVVFLLGGGA